MWPSVKCAACKQLPTTSLPMSKSSSQQDLDQFLFLSCAVPNTIDMSKPRDERVVDAMLQMRDSGRNPSVCSDSSNLHAPVASFMPPSLRSTHERPRMEDIEEDDEYEYRRRKTPYSEDGEKTPLVDYNDDDDTDHVKREWPVFNDTNINIDRRQPPNRFDVDDDDVDLPRDAHTPPRVASALRPVPDRIRRSMPVIDIDNDEYPIGAFVHPDDVNARARPPPASSPATTVSYHSQQNASPQAQRQETAYEKTLREMMAPPPPPPPAPAPVPVFHSNPARVASVRSQQQPRRHYASSVVSATSASTVKSAVESSVSHPNHTASIHSSGRRRRHHHHHRRHREARSQLAEIERENKMELLIELEKLQAMGVMLSFPLSMDHPEWKLKHELERHLAHQTLVQRVTLVKGIMKLGSMVIRWMCSSFLRLEGWDKYIAQELDTGRYDVSLEQVYRSIWRKGTPNPWMNLGLLIIGSAIAFHVGSVATGGAATTNASGAPGGMIGNILSSLFGGGGGSASGGSGFNPMSLVGSVLRNAGSGPARPRASSPNGEGASSEAAPIRPPTPPPVRPQSSAAPASEPTRVRARIPPPM